MIAKEITAEERKLWDELGYFPVVCRICDSVMLYPKMHYKPENFIGWECGECEKKYVNKEVRIDD